MDNPQSEFTKDDHDILAELNLAQDPQASGEQPASAEPQADAAPEPSATPAPAPARAEAPATAPTATAPAPVPEKAEGDLRGALRNARRSERRAREEAERLRRENEELKSKAPAVPPKPANPDELTDEEIAELDTDLPAVAKVARTLRAIQAAAPAPAPAPAAPVDEDYTPPPQAPEVQDAIDSVPELLTWQNDRDQTRWAAAVAADQLLRTLPAWKDRPLEERLAEATRRVKAELGAPAPSRQPNRTPAAAVANAPVAQPTGIGDFRGGAAPNALTPDYRRMSDEEIMASLPG